MKPKEKEFCRQMTMTADPVRAAKQAGFRRAERSAAQLLSRSDIAEEIRRLSGNLRSIYESTALCGLYRLACGGVGDALTPVFGESLSPDDLGTLDLSCVSEIRRTDKGVEVKLCDRIKAMDKLFELIGSPREQGSGSLLEAMALSAEALSQRGGVSEIEL